MRLPLDTCRCPGEECPLRWECARFRAEARAWTPVYAFAPWTMTSEGAQCASLLLCSALSSDSATGDAVTGVDDVVVGLGQSS